MSENSNHSYWGDDNQKDSLPMYEPEKQSDSNLSHTQDSHKNEDPKDDLIRWSASEYKHQKNSPVWYVMLFLIALLFIALDVLFMKSYTFSVLVVVMLVSVVVYLNRPPRMIDYTLSVQQGLYIGDDLHHFSEYKAFGIIKDGSSYFMALIPSKRFAPSMHVYFPEDIGERIVDVFGARIPMKSIKLDFIDLLVRKLHL